MKPRSRQTKCILLNKIEAWNIYVAPGQKTARDRQYEKKLKNKLKI